MKITRLLSTLVLLPALLFGATTPITNPVLNGTGTVSSGSSLTAGNGASITYSGTGTNNAKTLQGTTPSAAGLSVLSAPSAAAQRTALGLVIGTDVASADALSDSLRSPAVGPNSVVLLGDSITHQNGGPGETTSNPTYYAIGGYFTWANIQLGHRLVLHNNAGVAGERTDQMLARFDSTVAAYSPSIVIVMAGTNDVLQSVPYATIIANLEAIYDEVEAIGALCVASTIPPITTLSDANRTILQRVNRWIREQARHRSKFVVSDMGLAIVDTTTTTFATSWTPAAGMTSDGTHPAAVGAVRMGARLADDLRPILRPTSFLDSHSYDATNLLTNGNLVGTAPSAPTGWTVNTGDATWTYPARTDGLPGTWAQATLTGYLQLIGTNITSGFSEGEKVYATCEYELEYTGDVITSCYLALYRNGVNVAADPATFVQAVQVPKQGVLETVGYTIPSGTTALRPYLFLTTTGGTTKVLRVARFALRKGDPRSVTTY